MKTQVCITVDTEFSIAGAFSEPDLRQPVSKQNVLCELDGRSHGLGFILETLARQNIPATFFVEALNSNYFGDEPMRDIAHRILQAGHDVQLHLHPCWTYFRNPRWRDHLLESPPNDYMTRRSETEIAGLIAEGLATFERWNIPRPVALRTGGLNVNEAVYLAMRSMKLPIASNVGLAVYRPENQGLHFYSGVHRVNDVLEIPVLTYLRFRIGGWVNEKTLTITGTSWRELESLLWSAHHAQVSPVIILTHPHEFIKSSPQDPASTPRRVNRLNQDRFERLCSFLYQKREIFETVTFKSSSAGWQQISNCANERLDVSPVLAARGLLENRLNDMI